jgi:hypothetical protein
MVDPRAASAWAFYAGFALVLALAARRWLQRAAEPAQEGPPPVDRYWQDYYAYMKSYYATAQVMPPVADRRYLMPPYQ